MPCLPCCSSEKVYIESPKENNSECCGMTKAMQVALAVFALCAVAVTFTAVILNYPAASTTVYAIFATVGIIALAIFTIKMMKECCGDEKPVQAKPESVAAPTSTDAATPRSYEAGGGGPDPGSLNSHQRRVSTNPWGDG